MTYYYLDIKDNCKSCNGRGLTEWIGNDCPECLKKIDLNKMSNFQLKELKKAIKIKMEGR